MCICEKRNRNARTYGLFNLCLEIQSILIRLFLEIDLQIYTRVFHSIPTIFKVFFLILHTNISNELRPLCMMMIVGNIYSHPGTLYGYSLRANDG